MRRGRGGGGQSLVVVVMSRLAIVVLLLLLLLLLVLLVVVMVVVAIGRRRRRRRWWRERVHPVAARQRRGGMQSAQMLLGRVLRDSRRWVLCLVGGRPEVRSCAQRLASLLLDGATGLCTLHCCSAFLAFSPSAAREFGRRGGDGGDEERERERERH